MVYENDHDERRYDPGVIHKILDENYELSAFKFGDVDGNDALDLFIELKESLE
jgi:hypothetical protein